MLLAMDVSGATALLLPFGLLLDRFWGLQLLAYEVLAFDDATYPSNWAAISTAELDFFSILFSFGSALPLFELNGAQLSSDCVNVCTVLPRVICRWLAVPLDRDGDDEEDSGPGPVSSPEPPPKPELEDSTTWRCCEQRSELCLLSPVNDIFELRICYF